MNWHSLEAEEALGQLHSRPSGLTEQNAAERLKRFPPKPLPGTSPLRVFFMQFNNLLLWLLLAAAITAYEARAFVPILAGAFTIALIGFFRDMRSERAVERLRRLCGPRANVVRGGVRKTISTSGLVFGDIIMLSAGDRVPADARLLDAVHLRADESRITGNRVPVKKHSRPVPQDTAASMQASMVFGGTQVVSGRGTAVVVRKEGEPQENLPDRLSADTPYLSRLAGMEESLGIFALLMCAAVFVAGMLKSPAASGQSASAMFLLVAALALVAAPDGLAQTARAYILRAATAMSRQNLISREASSVEKLGSCGAICVRKTGILTQGEMTVREIYADNRHVHVTGHGHEPAGIFEEKNTEIDPAFLRRLFEVAALCNNAELRKTGESWEAWGEPAEAALLAAAEKAGIKKSALEQAFPRIDEIAFDPGRRMMTTAHRTKKGAVAFTKGAPEDVLEKCTRAVVAGSVKKLTDAEKSLIAAKHKEMCSRGLHVLAAAYRSHVPGRAETKMIFVGLIGMIDAPRPESAEAVRKCAESNITLAVLTGDSAETAGAVAQELGMANALVMTGRQACSGELPEADAYVFARVSAVERSEIVRRLKSTGRRVAMFGKSLWDVPAMEQADLAVCPESASDAAREASSITVSDSSLKTVVSGIASSSSALVSAARAGQYVVSMGIGAVIAVFAAVVLGYSTGQSAPALPFRALHLVWAGVIIRVISGTVFYPGRPQHVSTEILGTRNAGRILFSGAVLAVGTICVFTYFLGEQGAGYAMSASFLVFVLFLIFNALGFASDRSIFREPPGARRLLASALILAVPALLLYPPASGWLMLASPRMDAWLFAIAVAASALLFGEIYKFVSSNG